MAFSDYTLFLSQVANDQQGSKSRIHTIALHTPLSSRPDSETPIRRISLPQTAVEGYLPTNDKILNRISTQQTCKATKNPVNCTLPGPQGFATNADIADIGVGVVNAYEITALLTLIFASLLLILDLVELYGADSRKEKLEEENQRPYRARFRRILEAVVLTFSDQQLITGLAMLTAVLYYLGCEISAYHYDIVCNLILMSLVTHLASLAVISRYFSNWLLGPFRVILIIVAFSLAGVMFAERDNTHFPTGVPSASSTSNMTAPPLLAAAACFTSENISVTDQFAAEFDVFRGPDHVTGLVEYAVLFIISVFGLLIAISQPVVTSSARKHAHLSVRQWIFVFRTILLVGAWAIAIAAYLKFNSLRKWLAASPWPADNAEHQWDFGQLMPCLLLILAPLAFFEACGDYWTTSQAFKSGYEYRSP